MTAIITQPGLYRQRNGGMVEIIGQPNMLYSGHDIWIGIAQGKGHQWTSDGCVQGAFVDSFDIIEALPQERKPAETTPADQLRFIAYIGLIFQLTAAVDKLNACVIWGKGGFAVDDLRAQSAIKAANTAVMAARTCLNEQGELLATAGVNSAAFQAGMRSAMRTAMQSRERPTFTEIELALVALHQAELDMHEFGIVGTKPDSKITDLERQLDDKAYKQHKRAQDAVMRLIYPIWREANLETTILHNAEADGRNKGYLPPLPGYDDDIEIPDSVRDISATEY